MEFLLKKRQLHLEILFLLQYMILYILKMKTDLFFWAYPVKNRLLVVVHTDRHEKIRIISARKAIQKEKRQYENYEK